MRLGYGREALEYLAKEDIHLVLMGYYDAERWCDGDHSNGLKTT